MNLYQTFIRKLNEFQIKRFSFCFNNFFFSFFSCQFIVKEDADYTPHLADPDLLVDWNAIEQIVRFLFFFYLLNRNFFFSYFFKILQRLQSGTLVSCPICLDSPIAAKMTRCGHVYCWPCILHYLALSDKSWRKCPICFEAVHKKDLKRLDYYFFFFFFSFLFSNKFTFNFQF